VILVRIYLIDTCAVFFSFYCSSFLPQNAIYPFCLVFFRVQPQRKILSSACVCVYFSYDCSVRALFLSSIGDYLSLSLFFLSSFDNSNKYHTFNILTFSFFILEQYKPLRVMEKKEFPIKIVKSLKAFLHAVILLNV